MVLPLAWSPSLAFSLRSGFIFETIWWVCIFLLFFLIPSSLLSPLGSVLVLRVEYALRRASQSKYFCKLPHLKVVNSAHRYQSSSYPMACSLAALPLTIVWWLHWEFSHHHVQQTSRIAQSREGQGLVRRPLTEGLEGAERDDMDTRTQGE